MGINGLLPQLRSITHRVHISSFRGRTVAIDAYCLLHRGAYACARELVEGEKTQKHVIYCLNRIDVLVQNGVTPIVVFDGGPLPNKCEEERARARGREEAKEKARRLWRQGSRTAATECYQRAVDITPEIAHDLVIALKEKGIRFIVAPYEADAQMAYLALNGFADAVMTEDSDLLTYGCPVVLFKADHHGECDEIRLCKLPLCRELSFAGWTHGLFQEMCVMAGCDFVKALPGIGIKKAHSNIRRTRSFLRSLRSLKFDGVTIPSGYEIRFQRALWTFRHQRVYCPQREALVYLREPIAGSLKSQAAVPSAADLSENEQDFLGPPIPNDLAKRIAEGEAHPITHFPFPAQSSRTYSEKGFNTINNVRDNVAELNRRSSFDPSIEDSELHEIDDNVRVPFKKPRALTKMSKHESKLLVIPGEETVNGNSFDRKSQKHHARFFKKTNVLKYDDAFGQYKQRRKSTNSLRSLKRTIEEALKVRGDVVDTSFCNIAEQQGKVSLSGNGIETSHSIASISESLESQSPGAEGRSIFDEDIDNGDIAGKEKAKAEHLGEFEFKRTNHETGNDEKNLPVAPLWLPSQASQPSSNIDDKPSISSSGEPDFVVACAEVTNTINNTIHAVNESPQDFDDQTPLRSGYAQVGGVTPGFYQMFPDTENENQLAKEGKNGHKATKFSNNVDIIRTAISPCNLAFPFERFKNNKIHLDCHVEKELTDMAPPENERKPKAMLDHRAFASNKPSIDMNSTWESVEEKFIPNLSHIPAVTAEADAAIDSAKTAAQEAAKFCKRKLRKQGQIRLGKIAKPFIVPRSVSQDRHIEGEDSPFKELRPNIFNKFSMNR